MQRLTKVGKITPKSSNEVRHSRIGIGFEKLDRGVFDPEKAYDKVAAIGVKWVRIQSGWARTEKEKGVYDFAWLDSIVDNLLARGLQPWLCLCYGNGLYDENAAKIFGAVGVPPIFTDEQRAAWDAYVRETVAHYKGRITHYEVWNEPDGKWCWKHGVNAFELGAFTAATAKAVKAVDPTAEVIALAHCIPDLRYIHNALSVEGMAENIDAISFHEYVTDETHIPERVDSMRAVADMFKKGIRLIQGESGSQSKSGGNGALKKMLWSQKAQMKQLARHTMMDLSTEVEFMSYFSCLDMVEALKGAVGDTATYKDYGYFGVLGADFDEEGRSVGTYSPKLSYYALQTIAAVFAEDYTVAEHMPVLSVPSYFEPYMQQDCTEHELVRAFYRRENGSECLVFWNPKNILTTDWVGTTSFQVITQQKKVRLVDLCNGDVYTVPDTILTDHGDGCLRFDHLPVTDCPMALLFGDFCDWSENV